MPRKSTLDLKGEWKRDLLWLRSSPERHSWYYSVVDVVFSGCAESKSIIQRLNYGTVFNKEGILHYGKDCMATYNLD